ncbi:hypothetical protein ACFSHQ_11895 [Gemmobacter lanyuensis]
MDEEMRLQATGTLLMENDRVRVWRYDFAPGAETGWHVHGHDYVITTLTDCALRLELPGARCAKALSPPDRPIRAPRAPNITWSMRARPA